MRSALFLPLLALAACAPSDETGEEKRAPATPFGFELASAKEAPGSADAMLVDIAPDDLAPQLGTDAIRLIDVRTDAEVAEGMIPGAEHIPLSAFEPEKLDLSDGRQVVLYCRSGRRSAKAGEQLSAHTGEPAAHLSGGILAWKEAGGAVALPD